MVLRREIDEVEAIRREVEREKEILKKVNEEMEREQIQQRQEQQQQQQQAGPPSYPPPVPAKRPPPEPVYEDDLKPGNYLVCAWEGTCDNAGESVTMGAFSQLGAWLPHGVSFLELVAPADVAKQAETNPRRYFKDFRQVWFGRTPAGNALPLTDMKTALSRLLDFLERGCKTVRPSYDGAVLLSHQQECIPGLLRVVRHAGLGERFARVVKGLGDSCSFLAQCHMKRFLEADATGTDRMNLSLSKAHAVVLGSLFNPSTKTADLVARATLDVVTELLQGKVTFQNFFSRFIWPLKSKLITKMASFRTLKGRVEVTSKGFPRWE